MLRGGVSPHAAAAAAAAHVGSAPATLELDLDAVANAPASAAAASGFTGAEFRAMASMLARTLDVHGAHVAEGAPMLGPWPADMLGKLCAEVVRDVATAVVSR
jgi:arginase family enzyme